MKKKVLFVAAAFFATAAFAQDGLTSKKGEAFLPEAGDWALGFDGTPFLEYGGNLFNGTQNNSVNAAWVGNTPSLTIVGKYFKDESTAYRAKVRIGFGSASLDAITDTSTTTLIGEITDEISTSNFNITLGGGIEKRKGNTRIQGFYGAEALISFGASSTEYTYADQNSGTNTGGDVHFATFTDFGGNNLGGSIDPITGLPTGISDERVLENTAGSTFAFSLRAFIGVEWFIAPKVSVAAEYGWGLVLSSTGEGEIDTEQYTISTGDSDLSNVARKHTTGGSSAFGIDTDNNGGVITIMFHF